MARDLIELERRFAPLAAPSDRQAYPQDHDRNEQSEGWDDLLKHRWVVVLGEAGTGKSKEFEFRVNSLCSKGHTAFYLDIETLSAEGLLVVGEDADRLDAWLKSNGYGYFFLDSVDEEKLQRQSLDCSRSARFGEVCAPRRRRRAQDSRNPLRSPR